MKAFWWYQQDSIAGMARPGFNACRWFDLPFDEALLMGWLGQHSTGPLRLTAFHAHLEHFLPKVISFYPIDERGRRKILDDLHDPSALSLILNRLAERSRFLSDVSIDGEQLHFRINDQRLREEIEFLKSRNIRRIVTLTEAHHLAEDLGAHFDLDHISIVDMSAPTRAQAEELAEIMKTCERRGEGLTVHCLAGIGRTSTMIMAAEILRGKEMAPLLSNLRARNPSFQFVGSQAEFVRRLAADLAGEA